MAGSSAISHLSTEGEDTIESCNHTHQELDIHDLGTT